MSDEVFDKELGEIESQIVSLRYALFQLRKKYSNKESKKDEEIQEIQTICNHFMDMLIKIKMNYNPPLKKEIEEIREFKRKFAKEEYEKSLKKKELMKKMNIDNEKRLQEIASLLKEKIEFELSFESTEKDSVLDFVLTIISSNPTMLKEVYDYLSKDKLKREEVINRGK